MTGHPPAADAAHPPIGILGTGAIGAAVCTALLASGRPVVVWNRDPERTVGPVTDGALAVTTVREVVDVAPVVLAPVTDHAAVADLVAAAGDLTGTVVVSLCTGAPDEVRSTARSVGNRGGAYLAAGVRSGPEAFAAGAGSLLVGGPRALVDEHRSTLEALGEVRWCGEEVHAAATLDLTLFGLWYDAQLGLLRAVRTLADAGLDLEEHVPDLAQQLAYVGTGTSDVVAELRSGTFPRGPADLVEHLTVLRKLRSERRNLLGDGGLGPVVARLETLVAAGRGALGLTALADDATPR